MRQPNCKVLRVSLLLALIASPVQAQRPLPRPLPRPLVLEAPASARALALANAGLALGDADALFLNPAMVQTARGAAGSWQRAQGGATAGALAAITTVGPVSVGIGGQHASDDGLLPVSGSAFTVALARTIKGQRIGLAVKYLEEFRALARDGGVAVDLGYQRPLAFGTLAVSVQQLGPDLSLGGVSLAMPRRLSAGWFGSKPVHVAWDLAGGAQVAVEADGFVQPVGAAEAAYVPVQGVAVTFRGGVRAPRDRMQSVATAGFGVTVDHFSLDYGAEPSRAGRPTVHRIGIRVK